MSLAQNRSNQAKALAFGLSFLLVASCAYAEDSLMEGGRSPNGRYEVRLVRVSNSEPSDYAIHIHAARTGKSLFTLDSIGGYLRYPAAVERCRALWHSSSQFVAVTDQGTRHSRELYVLAIDSDRVERLPFPDYVQNALGRVGATWPDFACVSSPIRWDEDDLVLQFHFTANSRHSYTCEVVLHISHGEHSAPSIGLKSVSKPTEQDG